MQDEAADQTRTGQAPAPDGRPNAPALNRWHTSEDWGFVPGESGHYPPHRETCFGCGPENEQGLGLSVRDDGAFVEWDDNGTPLEGKVLAADITFGERFGGGPAVAHGGAVSAVFDDVLGTVPMAHGYACVTARLSVDYRRPVILGTDFVVRAWPVSRTGRKTICRGEMVDPKGRVVAEGETLMVELSEGHFQRALADVPTDQLPEDIRPFVTGETYP